VTKQITEWERENVCTWHNQWKSRISSLYKEPPKANNFFRKSKSNYQMGKMYE
jgi:hypothetical protein